MAEAEGAVAIATSLHRSTLADFPLLIRPISSKPFAKNAKDGAPRSVADASKIKSQGHPAGGTVHSRHSSPASLATEEKGLRYSLEMGVRCIRERLAFALADTIDNGVVDQPKA